MRSVPPANGRQGGDTLKSASTSGSDEGATSAYLGVDTDNHNRATALYESCGFRMASQSTAYRKPFSRQEPAP